MARKFNAAFLLMELLVSLAMLSVAFASFLALYSSVCRHHAAAQHRAAAIMLLQSVLEKVRVGQVPEARAATAWQTAGDGYVVCPAAPAPYPLESNGQRYQWQLVATRPPEPGKLCTVQAVIQWQEATATRHVDATTQVLWP